MKKRGLFGLIVDLFLTCITGLFMVNLDLDPVSEK